MIPSTKNPATQSAIVKLVLRDAEATAPTLETPAALAFLHRLAHAEAPPPPPRAA